MGPWAGFSTTTGLMIDVSQMNALSYDDSSGVAVAAAGVRNSDVYEALRAGASGFLLIPRYRRSKAGTCSR